MCSQVWNTFGEQTELIQVWNTYGEQTELNQVRNTGAYVGLQVLNQYPLHIWWRYFTCSMARVWGSSYMGEMHFGADFESKFGGLSYMRVYTVCLSIMHTSYILIWLETFWAFTHVDTYIITTCYSLHRFSSDPGHSFLAFYFNHKPHKCHTLLSLIPQTTGCRDLQILRFGCIFSGLRNLSLYLHYIGERGNQYRQVCLNF